MKYQNSKVFHNLMTRVRKRLLKNDNIDTLNNKIIDSIIRNNTDKNDVIV